MLLNLLQTNQNILIDVNKRQQVQIQIDAVSYCLKQQVMTMAKTESLKFQSKQFVVVTIYILEHYI